MATYRSWSGSGVTQRANSTAYSLGARMQPLITDTSTNYAVARRYVWECTTAGTSGASVPAWSASYTPDSSTVTDGSVTWTCRKPGYSSGSTVDWTFASIFASYTTPLMSAGDVLLIHYTSQEASNNSAHTLAPTADNCILLAVDKDSSEAYTPMGSSGYLVNSGVNSAARLNPAAVKLRADGLTLRYTGTSSTPGVDIANGDDGQLVARDLRLELTGANSSPYIAIGGAADTRSACSIYGLTLYRAHTGQLCRIGGRVEIVQGSLAGAAVTTIFSGSNLNDTVSARVQIQGMDLSGASATATLVTDGGVAPATFDFVDCLLPASYTILSGAGSINESGLEAFLKNCKAGTDSGIHAYANALGSMTRNTSITYNSETFSWKIDGNSTTRSAPFRTPWYWGEIETGSSVTPRFEILRDGSTTAFTDAEVWIERVAQITSGSPVKTYASSEAGVASSGSSLAAGAGLGTWAGESGTAWSGKVDAGAITPTGDACAMRLCVATTAAVYVNQGWLTS